MNWAQFKDPHCYLAFMALWFITQVVGGSDFAKIISTDSVNSLGIHLRKTRMCCSVKYLTRMNNQTLQVVHVALSPTLFTTKELN